MSRRTRVIPHARHRRRQRLGVKLSRNVYCDVLCQIERGRARCLGPCDGAGEAHRRRFVVLVCGVAAEAAYDPASGLVVTLWLAEWRPGMREVGRLCEGNYVPHNRGIVGKPVFGGRVA